MRMIRQIAAVTAMNLQSLPLRLRPSIVVVVGIAGVVAVLVSMLGMATGLGRMADSGALGDRAVVLSTGANAEQVSLLNQDMVTAIVNADGVRRGQDGKPLVSPEVLLTASLPGKGHAAPADVPFRGLGPLGFAVHPEFVVIEGRRFTPGLHEIIVGKAVRNQFAGLEPGRHIGIRGVDWTVVGVFASSGGVHESEIMADADTLNAAIQRSGFQSVTVALTSSASFKAFAASLTRTTASAPEVMLETEFYAQSTNQIRGLITFVAYVIGGIMALGATFGALTTVSSMVAMRATEIATLRAIGFGPMAVVTSVLVEALLLALIGSVLGGVLAWVGFSDFTVSTRNGGQRLAFDLVVTPELLLVGMWWAITIGLLSGLFPAIRAARLPVARVLRGS